MLDKCIELRRDEHTCNDGIEADVSCTNVHIDSEYDDFTVTSDDAC